MKTKTAHIRDGFTLVGVTPIGQLWEDIEWLIYTQEIGWW